ncbi:MAG: hypothetical protein Q9213_001378 [Squamulea squamosa]
MDVEMSNLPGARLEAGPPTSAYHRDFLKRAFSRDIHDRDFDHFVNPYDGKLARLVVQCSGEISREESSSSWSHTSVKSGSPWMIRLSNWAMSRFRDSKGEMHSSILKAALRWIPACCAIVVVVSLVVTGFGTVTNLDMQTSLPIQVAATPSNFGRYDCFLYKDWRYPREARNKAENKAENKDGEDGIGKRSWDTTSSLRKRILSPKYLCVVQPNDSVKVSNEEEIQALGEPTAVGYVFISFYREHFQSKEAKHWLRDVGVHAARTFGVNAYWISESCLHNPTEKDEAKIKEETEETVWNMSDIIRHARAVVIAVPGPLDHNSNGETLRQWGERAWTMPELILYEGKEDILIYEKSKESNWKNYTRRPRREMWHKAWEDHRFSGQLIDHFEGSLHLTPLELQTMALYCLEERCVSAEYLPGDLAYILMGFLRQRPNVVRDDSKFAACARLSMANDSNLLLERLICLSPIERHEKWWRLGDTWGAKLWDIYPKTQVCGLGNGDTVILDGARGAAIRWDKFVPVRTLGQETMRHRILRYSSRFAPVVFFTGLILIIYGASLKSSNGGPNPFKAFGGVFVGLAGVVVLLLPYLLRVIYCLPTRHSQPFFFGIQGYMDLYPLELLIFGSYEGRLTWSLASSPLSRHALDRRGMKKDFELTNEKSMQEQNFFAGVDPVQSDQEIKRLVQSAKHSKSDDYKIFTLVDTYTMTVTIFEAQHPPIAAIICGAEGGMQRALLCSEDWTTGTLYREAVLRMETRVWDKMDTLARIRLGLKRGH